MSCEVKVENAKGRYARKWGGGGYFENGRDADGNAGDEFEHWDEGDIMRSHGTEAGSSDTLMHSVCLGLASARRRTLAACRREMKAKRRRGWT